MGLFQAAVKTYDNLAAEGIVGKYEEGKEPLAPVGHMIKKADLIISIDSEGHFLRSEKVPKDAGKFIIPVTEESAGRTSTSIRPNPLCDQLCYLASYDNASEKKQKEFLLQIKKWKDSPYDDPKVDAVYRYVSGNTILKDLEKDGNITIKNGVPENEKALVIWNVHGVRDTSAVWQDQVLMSSYTKYALSVKEAEKDKHGFCMVSGQEEPLASQHMKGVFSLNGNAKLISANDEKNFTYRGRFLNDEEALTVGFVSSQKAHNALKWITTNFGRFGKEYGGRAFVCWSPEQDDVPDPAETFLKELYGDDSLMKPYEFTDYRQALAKELMGYRSGLKNELNSHTVIVSFDAATPGRLSIVYYNELSTGDYLKRLRDWDEFCSWYFPKGYLMAPSLLEIAKYTFGTESERTKTGNIDIDNKINKQAVSRLLKCRLGKESFPYDMEHRLVENASRLCTYGSFTREQLLSIACAAVHKYHHDKWKEDLEMELDKDRNDRSYQFGRLLAVYEMMERRTFDSDKDREREPNAIRLQSVYCNRPLHYAFELDKQMEQAYIPKLKPGSRTFYKNLIGEIIEKIYREPQEEWDKPLEDTYLIGYYLQRRALKNDTAKQKKSLGEAEES